MPSSSIIKEISISKAVAFTCIPLALVASLLAWERQYWKEVFGEPQVFEFAEFNLQGLSAPDFILTATESKPLFTREDLGTGSPAIVYFFPTWSHRTSPDLAAINGLKARGFTAFGVVVLSEPTRIDTFFEHHKWMVKDIFLRFDTPFEKVGIDEYGEMLGDWGAGSANSVFVVDGQGTIVLQSSDITDSYAVSHIVPLLEQLQKLDQ